MEGFLLPVEIKILDIEGPFDRMLFGRICHLVEQTIRTKPLDESRLAKNVILAEVDMRPKMSYSRKDYLAENAV